MGIKAVPGNYSRVHAHIPPSAAFDMAEVAVNDADDTVLPDVETLDEADVACVEFSIVNDTGVVLQWSKAGSDGSVYLSIEDGRLVTLPFSNPAMVQLRTAAAAGNATAKIVVRY